MNLALKHARLHEGVRALRFAYDGFCIDFVDLLLHHIEAHPVDKVHYPDCRLAYFETPFNPRWDYHAALELHGVIHDLWFPEVLPTARFMKVIGSDKVDYPGEEELAQKVISPILTAVLRAQIQNLKSKI